MNSILLQLFNKEVQVVFEVLAAQLFLCYSDTACTHLSSRLQAILFIKQISK